VALKSLNNLRGLKDVLTRAHKAWIGRGGRVRFAPRIKLSLSARLSSDIPDGIVIGEETLVAFKTLLFTRDPFTGDQKPIRIGSRCFIGGSSTVAPGVTIGDHCIVGAGSVVLEDVPSGCAVGGNPARVLRTGLELLPYGVLPVAVENSRKLFRL
jgi:maltose O-acetyltransferase